MNIPEERIGVNDSFFDSGGHSLRVIRLAASIQRAFDVNIGIDDLFTHGTIREQAGLILESGHVEFEPIPTAQSRTGYPLSSMQQGIRVIAQRETANIAYNMAGNI